MARAGGRVFPSGRLTVHARPATYKRRAAVRKISTTSLDSGYSLCSTDSEDQVLVINKGLDQCAALLQDILQNDATEKKPHKVPTAKGSVKSSTATGKKNTARKPTTAPHVYKEKGFLRKSVPAGGCNADVQRPRVCAQSPVVPTTSCDHVPTQMQRLHRMPTHVICHPVSVPSLSEQGPEAAAPYNCRLPTSTPALSPQPAASPQTCNNYGYHQTRPPGGTSHLLSSMIATSAAHTVPSLIQNSADLLSQLSNYKNQIQDSDLLQCVAAHLAQLQRSENLGQNLAEPVCDREGTTGETDETSSGEDDTVNMAAVRDTSCQTSFTKYNKSPEQTQRKIRTVKCLLGEIKALVADQDDGEGLRLVTELEHIVSLLPGVVGNTNVHAEMAIALQPLRSENAQLRRRLRILNQQLRDRERGARSDEQNHELTSLQSMNETLQHQLEESQKCLQSLQSKHEDLIQALDFQREENRKFTQISQEKDQEIGQIRQQNDVTSAKMKMEVDEAVGKVRGVQFKLEASEKENQILEITLRQRDTEVGRLRDLTRTLQASMAKLLCDLGKENAKPRRESNLTQSALDSYDKQLQSEQCPASTSIMHYLQRLETDHVFTSTDTIFPDKPRPTTPQMKYNNGVTSALSDFTAGKTCVFNRGSESTHNPAPPCNLQKQSLGLGSESCYVTSDEYKPDETMYLPLSSSPHNGLFVPSQRQMCTPPQVCGVEKGMDFGSAYASNGGFSTMKKYPVVPKDSTNTPDTLDQITKINQEILTMEPCTETASPSEDPSRTFSPVLQQMRSLQVLDHLPSDHSMLDFRSGKSDWTISSFSTFTSHDEQDFRIGLAALDANIAKLQRTLQISVKK
ncbi:coiled-coil domain-containing protein 14 [Mixophyes fleayi]|uniref:coiled-coil domain-containing protein 14 n=1 Tax=Mixophyes fleayi TaxID=3061075 RepID=UPI003F4E372B